MNNGRLIILAIGLKGAWGTTTRERIIVEQGLLTLPTGFNRQFSTDKGLLASLKHILLHYTVLDRIIRKEMGGGGGWITFFHQICQPNIIPSIKL